MFDEFGCFYSRVQPEFITKALDGKDERIQRQI